MADIGTLVVKITSDISGLTKGLEDAQSKAQQVGKGMQKAGAGLTAGVTVPMVRSAVAAAAMRVFISSPSVRSPCVVGGEPDGMARPVRYRL